MIDNQGSLKGYEGADEIEFANPLKFIEKKADYVIPAAVEKSINKGNASNIKCKAVFEGANGPTTFAAEETLLKNGIVVVPDLLANGGGVTCSYFEWLKNLQHVAHGQMTRKFEQETTLSMLKMIGYDTNDVNIKGSSEIDIVYSALDEIMTTATSDNWKFA